MIRNQPGKQKKAVILITIDALRADHLKSYGYHRNTAPYLEKLAQEGIIFLNAVTNGPETPSSFSSIFTSTLPLIDGGYSPLPAQKILFTQILKENTIYTYGIHSNPNLGKFFNYDRGYDVFLDGMRYLSSESNQRNLISSFLRQLSFENITNKLLYRLKGFNKIKSWIRRKFPFLTEILLPFAPIAYNAPYIVSKLISLLKTIKKPFFIWAHFMDVHSPYNPPSRNVLKFRKYDFSNLEREFLTKEVYSMASKIKKTSEMIENLKILYDSEINFIDESLKNFFEILKHTIKKRCLIIITSDHGEGFNEHAFFGHQGYIFEEVLKVPLMIIDIDNKSSKKIIHDTVQLIDLAPTILDYFEIEIPEIYQGKSLLPLIKGKSHERGEIIISECYQKEGLMKRNRNEGHILLAIRRQKWKYIFDEEKRKEFLFNLELDPLEKINISEGFPEKMIEFRTIKDYHIKKAHDINEEKSKIVNAIGFFKKKDL